MQAWRGVDGYYGRQGYNGQNYYMPAQVVVDKGFITANETASVEFAKEIFKVLNLADAKEIEAWYDYYKNGAVR